VRALFLIEGWISPAPRYRVLQYLDFLRKQGVHCEVRALHGERYPFFSRWPLVGQFYKTLVRARRWLQISDAGHFDVVVQQRLTLPFSSAIERRLFRLNPRVVFDFDDALYRTGDGADARRKRVFETTVRGSREVVAGSRYLAQRCTREVTVIPTVIDTGRYQPVAATSATVTIGWMGTYSNLPNLRDVLPSVARVLERYPEARLQIVADQDPKLDLRRYQFIDWCKTEEIERLQGFDIGIMPLRDTLWNRGKCAFKIVQYMSVGIPVVASKVGANVDVVLDGQTGFLVGESLSWESALSRLLDDPELRASMGAAGRKRCVQSYSVVSQQETLLRVLRRAAQQTPSPEVEP